jgi:nucleoside-diphosphate-sugar epimerase
VRHTAADTSVAREAFGYQPQVRLETGLLRMIESALPEPSVAAS